MQTISVNRWPSLILSLCLIFGSMLVATPIGTLTLVHATEPMVGGIQTVIKARLDGEGIVSSLTCRGEMICGIRMLPLAYRKRSHLPLWIGNTLDLDKAEALADAIRLAEKDGLASQDYHLEAIDDLLADICEQASDTGFSTIDPDVWADLDLILTDAFLLYGSHLAAGRVNPETLHTDWKVNPGAVDLPAALERAASTGKIEAALSGLRPAHNEYNDLRGALAGLRSLAATGSWQLVDDRKTLRPGDRSPAIVDLRRRLTASGDLAQTIVDDETIVFDDALTAGVKRFQQHNGLKADGIVGRHTFGLLNIPVEQRIRQVELNLERWRWLPHELGPRHIMVNTADFNLNAVDNDRTALQMRVVVGRPARRSPVFSADMTYIVANPYWNVPTTIAVKDILPELQKDVSYLTPRGIRIFENWKADAAELDPATIDWQAYHANRFPFRLRQDPGPYNALGRIKFMFPNQFAVYLHDTPNRALFKRVQRDFSSGCIRVESPTLLADFVLAGDKRWTMERLNAALENGSPRILWLTHPIPVHLLYMTTWVDAAGTLQFRRDIYNRDRDLARALSRRRPNTPHDFSHDTRERTALGKPVVD